MPNSKHGLRLDLRTLILVLCALTALVMLCASYFASYRVQRQLLIDHALEANRVYATKLASITETFISNAQQQLSFSAGVQGRQLADAQALQAETERVLSQSMAFNSTFVLDADGVLLAISPASLRHLVGSRMHSPGVEEALKMPMPDPDSATDRLFADEPVLLEDGKAPWSGFQRSGGEGEARAES